MSLNDKLKSKQKKIPRNYRHYSEEEKIERRRTQRKQAPRQKVSRKVPERRDRYVREYDEYEDNRGYMDDQDSYEYDEYDDYEEVEYIKDTKETVKPKKKKKKKKKFLKKDKPKKAAKEKKVNYIDKNITDLIPITEVKNGMFMTSTGCFDMIEIEGKDIYSLGFDELKRDIAAFRAVYKITDSDIKLVSLRFPVDTKKQQEYLRYKIKKNKKPLIDDFLHDKLNELIYLEKTRTNKEFYIFIYGKNQEDVFNNKKNIERLLYGVVNVLEIGINKKINIIRKMYNQNTCF